MVNTLTSPAFVDALGDKLGIENLGQYPVIVHVCRYYNKRHGTIHTDSKSKVATAPLYLNERWPETSDGCLRFLSRSDDIDAMLAPEIRPLYGDSRCSSVATIPSTVFRSQVRRKPQPQRSTLGLSKP